MRHHSSEDEFVHVLSIPGLFINLLDGLSLLLYQSIKEVIQTLVSLITLISQVLRHLFQGAIDGFFDLLGYLLSKLSLLLLVPHIHLVHGFTSLLHPLFDRVLIDVSIPGSFKPVFDFFADRLVTRAVLTFLLLSRSRFIFWSRIICCSNRIIFLEPLDHKNICHRISIWQLVDLLNGFSLGLVKLLQSLVQRSIHLICSISHIFRHLLQDAINGTFDLLGHALGPFSRLLLLALLHILEGRGRLVGPLLNGLLVDIPL